MKPCFLLGYHYLYSVRGRRRCRFGFRCGIGGLLVVVVAMVLLSDTTETSTSGTADAFVLRSISRRNGPAIGHPLSNRDASSSTIMGPAAPRAASRDSAKPSRCSATTTTAEDPSTGDFLEEMFRDRGCQGEPGAVQIRVDPATGYRGLYVSSPEIIREGDYVFAVPFSSTWEVEGSGSGGGGEDEKDEEELSDAQRGLRFWNWKQSQERQHEEGNGNSDWKSYLDLLPKRNNNDDNDNDNDNSTDGEWFDPTPEFWSEEQIAALELPLALERVRSRRESVAELAASVPDVEEDDLRFATWLINSRVVTVVLGGEEEEEVEEEEKGFEMEQEDAECDNDECDDDKDHDDDYDESFSTACVLVPLLDMINHSSDSPNAYFSVLGDDGDSDGDSDGDTEEELFYAAIADRDLHPGEEILISYEQESTLDLLLRYGFLPASESSQPSPADVEVWESIAASLEDDDDDDEEEEEDDSDSTASGVGWWRDGSCWSTTVGEDEERKVTVAAALSSGVGSNQQKHDLEIELTTLDFRIRMKRAHREWNAGTLVSAQGM